MSVPQKLGFRLLSRSLLLVPGKLRVPFNNGVIFHRAVGYSAGKNYMSTSLWRLLYCMDGTARSIPTRPPPEEHLRSPMYNRSRGPLSQLGRFSKSGMCCEQFSLRYYSAEVRHSPLSDYKVLLEEDRRCHTTRGACGQTYSVKRPQNLPSITLDIIVASGVNYIRRVVQAIPQVISVELNPNSHRSDRSSSQ